MGLQEQVTKLRQENHFMQSKISSLESMFMQLQVSINVRAETDRQNQANESSASHKGYMTRFEPPHIQSQAQSSASFTTQKNSSMGHF